jgi:hypothetical protein
MQTQELQSQGSNKAENNVTPAHMLRVLVRLAALLRFEIWLRSMSFESLGFDQE